MKIAYTNEEKETIFSWAEEAIEALHEHDLEVANEMCSSYAVDEANADYKSMKTWVSIADLAFDLGNIIMEEDDLKKIAALKHRCDVAGCGPEFPVLSAPDNDTPTL